MWLLFVAGSIPLPWQKGTAIMTNELSLDTLDQVSGGWTMGQKLAIAREEATLRMEVREHELTPAQANANLKTFEFRLMLQSYRFHI